MDIDLNSLVPHVRSWSFPSNTDTCLVSFVSRDVDHHYTGGLVFRSARRTVALMDWCPNMVEVEDIINKHMT